jgi:hypothetical protein
VKNERVNQASQAPLPSQCLLNAETGQLNEAQNHFSGNATTQELATATGLLAPRW